MSNQSPATSRFELLIAVGIAVVSTTTALVAWRSSLVASSAGDASRAGLIDSIKQQAADSEDWRKVYQEASFAQVYTAYAAEIKTLEDSDDGTAQSQAVQLRQFLLPSLSQLSPLVADPTYQQADGSFDLDQRLADLAAENPDLAGLDPQKSFARADSYFAEQRWLLVDIVLLISALFWLTLAQITAGRLRPIMFAVGSAGYVLSLVGFVAVEVVFLIVRGSR